MGEYYLRLEAVNLANFVYDTSDLSTMRGGSQFVAVAGTVVENAVTGLEAISTGASAVLWSFDAVSDDAAKAVRKVAEKALRDDLNLMHATFVVDTVPANGGFRHVSESALALNRHRQMVAPSIAVPKTSSNRVCQLDGVRPAVLEIEKGKEKKWVSESVSRRRKFGKTERHQVVRLAAKRIGWDVRESKEFFDIAGNAPKGVGNLDGKMAVLFLDGNDFGALQREKCNIREQQREYDLALKEASKRILDSLLLEAKRNPCQWVNGEVLRLEVLMLAGDEIRIVVPAWCGWIALQRIFETVEELPKVLGKKLTWKAGLLFCQHHAPIRRMLGLADLLAGFAKCQSA